MTGPDVHISFRPIREHATHFVLAGATLAVFAAHLSAQQAARPSVSAVRLVADSHEIAVDGVLDEPAWQFAPVATGFRQREPHEGAPATEATEVRVLYDATNLYVSVLARHTRPEAIISRILQRDRLMEVATFEVIPRFTSDDAVAILFDPFHDDRNAVVFATNPNGAEFEALITDEGREFNIDWRAVWRVRSSRTADGWSAEFAIPFRTLRYPTNESGEPWGFNVYRMIRHKNEEVLWSGWSRATEGFHRVSAAGHLEGLTDLPRAGMNLELKPYLLSGATQEQAVPDIDTKGLFDMGIDAKYEVRPGLVLDMTANTDFAQVEVDDEQVNLTRFDLFYPEKREFFLENAGIFEFGFRSQYEPPPFLLFFSRQIGIHDDGEVPVLGGTRLTGRVGKQTVGLLDVVSDSAFDQPRTNFAVARVKRDVGSRHFIGAMATDRRSANSWNTTVGLDWSFWPTQALNIQGFGVRTATSDGDGDDFAHRLAVDYSVDQFGVSVHHLGVGPNATADAGFITRTDILRNDGFVRVTPRPRILGLRKLDLFVNSQIITRMDGHKQDWAVAAALSPEWNSGENLTVFYARGFNRIDEEFDLSDDVQVPPGDYDLWQAFVFGSTSRNRSIVLGTQSYLQGTFGGHIASLNGILTVNASANLSMIVRYARNYVDVPDGSFTADVGSLRLSVAFSTRLFVNALLQYNSLDDNVSANVRVNLIHSPGSDLFIVFNERRGRDEDILTDSLWDFRDRGTVLKLTYLRRM